MIQYRSYNLDRMCMYIYIQVYHGSPIIFPISCWIFSPPEIAAPEPERPAPPSEVPGGAQVFRSGAIEFHIEYII
jgi:hypothetical protein